MFRFAARLLLIAPFLLSGCMVRSLSPIYTDEDLIPMPALEGTWKGEEEGETISFVRDEDGYLFTYTENGYPVSASAHFANIGKKTYMDVTLSDSQLSDSQFDSVKEEDIPNEDLLEALLTPFFYYTTSVHMFYQVEVRDNALRMRSMDHAWIKARREKGRLWIAHFADGDSTLLTASTARVQRFLRKWANNEDAWDTWNEIPLMRADSPAATQ